MLWGSGGGRGGGGGQREKWACPCEAKTGHLLVVQVQNKRMGAGLNQSVATSALDPGRGTGRRLAESGQFLFNRAQHMGEGACVAGCGACMAAERAHGSWGGEYGRGEA